MLDVTTCHWISVPTRVTVCRWLAWSYVTCEGVSLVASVFPDARRYVAGILLTERSTHHQM
jgi:hypothetical protein